MNMADFLKQFRRIRSRCSILLLESECATIAMNNMHPQLRDRLVAIEYSDLAQLLYRASRVEQCIVKKEKRISHQTEPSGP